MQVQPYRARRPRASRLWQCLSGHFDAFLESYESHYRHDYGHLRPIIPEVVGKFMGCGDYSRGFARVRCDHCTHEYLLPFSCKGRWFCPSCHQKKVQLFGSFLSETILAPIPHRHITIGIPKMLRPYFRFHRGLIKELCRIAHGCILDFQRTALNLPDGVSGAVMAIHTFGEYLDFHPHLHALVADGLFARSGMFHVMPEVSLAPLEELFRSRVIRFLVKKELLQSDRARMLLGWRHSGFNIHRSRRIAPSSREDLERLAQYIIRNPFSLEKMHPNDTGDAIIYRSGLNPKIRRNFQVFEPCDFIAAITQHIPDKSFQLVRYYGWYSNKMRGQRLKREAEREAASAQGEPAALSNVEIIQVSGFTPRRRPSRKWRELIQKVWEADPLLCPNCQQEMRIIALIDEEKVIERILRHLGLWEEPVDVSRGPPEPILELFREETIIELCSDSAPWEEFPDPFPDYHSEPVFSWN
jgi:Zn finger protein HypA/HybF involved in hydrogenase expression